MTQNAPPKVFWCRCHCHLRGHGHFTRRRDRHWPIDNIPLSDRMKVFVRRSLNALGPEGMSDKETDNELSVGEHKVLSHHHEAWLHQDIYDFLHELDAMIKSQQPTFLILRTRQGNKPLHCADRFTLR
jgi:hypothetical protein